MACERCSFVCDAASRFCGGCGVALATASAQRETGSTAPRPRSAERRHLTVMFCDLVDSTGLSVRFDPEDLSHFFRRYQQACEQVVQRYDGFVARYTGDGLLAYFGYPAGSGHDAERAVRAGLDILESVRSIKLGPGLSLHSRIGIASGDVVVGEVVGDGVAREVTVVGETPNLAARLQAISAPDSVVICAETQRIVGGFFECTDLGRHNLKGFDYPVHAFTVIGEKSVESRFEAARGGFSGAPVGRDRELQLLTECLHSACEGVGHLVTICGEEGIGKSHLLEYFRASLDPHAVEIVRLYAAPHARGNVLHPVISFWRRYAGIESRDSNSVKLQKLERHLAKLGSFDVTELSALAALLSIPGDDRFPIEKMSPSELKSHTLHLLVAQVKKRCLQSPVVLVMEDLHWLDASSMEFLNLLLQETRTLPLMVIVTYRPEHKPRWICECQTTSIAMTHLGPTGARSLIDRVRGDRELPDSVVSVIAEKTDGVPLFIEELTKAVLENPSLIEQDEGFSNSASDALRAIPNTLQDSLLARLERPGPVKEVAQVGAALGREFRLDILRFVIDQPAELVEQALAELVAARLVIKWGTTGHETYRFRHNLIQEAAYGSMLRSRRRQLHERIASTLAQRFRAQVQGRPDLLARHYSVAQLYEQAFRYWFLASQQALRHFAHKEVEVHLLRGLELASKLPDEVEFVVMEFEMRALLASTLMVLHGAGHPDVGDTYQQVYNFCLEHEGLLDSFPIRFGQCRYLWATGRIREAVTLAGSLVQRVDAARDPGQFMAVNILLGVCLWHLGESERALRYLQRVSACYQAKRDASLYFTYMLDFGVLGGFYEALALLFLRRAEESWGVARGSLALARELGNPHAIGFGLLANIMVAIFSGETRKCIELCDECIRFAGTHGFAEIVAMAKVCAGSARLKSGVREGSLQLLREGVQEWEETGFSAWRPLFRGMLAEAHLLLGQYQQAQSELTTAQGLMERQEERQPAVYLSAIERQLAPLH